MKSRILITGAGGFVGRRLVSDLTQAGLEVVPIYRAANDARAEKSSHATRLDIKRSTDWQPHLRGVSVVVHLAGLAHANSGLYDSDDYREINVEATRNLGRQAAQSGVRRLIFVSSIKVNGDATAGKAFRADDRPAPVGSYAVSKYEAESALRESLTSTNLEVVIIRPPLVYGPNLKGNLASLLRAIQSGLPLPTGMVRNQRDLISVYNLCDLIRTCLSHPDAAGRTFLACDGEPVSTNRLIRQIASNIGKRARIWPVPVGVLKLAASMTGKSDQLDKLISSLRIDMTDTQSILDWRPPYSFARSLEMTFAEYGH